MTENTAKFAGGSSLKLALSDVVRESEKPTETRTGDEIKSDILDKLHRL